MFASQRHSVLLGAALFILLSPLAVAAENQDLQRGIEFFDDFEYQQALGHLQKVRNQPGVSEPDQAKALLYMALSHFTLRDKESARSEFNRALDLKPDLRLPADVSPKIFQFFDEIKESRKAPPDPRPAPFAPSHGVMSPSPARSRPFTWISAGLGGAALIGAGAFSFLAAQSKSDFDAEPWADRAEDLRTTTESRSLTANILFATGGAALLTAVILYFTEGKTDLESPTTSLSITPSGLDARWRF